MVEVCSCSPITGVCEAHGGKPRQLKPTPIPPTPMEMIAKLESDNAELRGDVAALWQRLGDVLSLCNPKEHRGEKDQIVLSHAKQLHSRWTVKR